MFWLIDYSFGHICQEKNANQNAPQGFAHMALNLRYWNLLLNLKNQDFKDENRLLLDQDIQEDKIMVTWKRVAFILFVSTMHKCRFFRQ